MKSLITALFFSAATMIEAAEFRTWTSIKGTTVEAQFLKLDGEEVYLVTKQPSEIKLKAADLSLADRQYLVEFAQADKELIFKGDITVPEHEIKLPNDFLKEMEQILNFPGESDLSFKLHETEHFVFASNGKIRVKGLAETAEACWHGMAFQHMEFRANWGDEKMLVIVPDGQETYEALGEYQVNFLKKAGQQDAAMHTENVWDKVGSVNMFVPEGEAKDLNLMPRATVFHTRDSKAFRDEFVPFQTHVICSALYSFQLGGMSQVSGRGFFALQTGHAYYKEILLCKKTQTNLLSSGSEGEIASKSGFKDGRSWARTLRSLVKRGKVEPKLQEMLDLDVHKLDPEKLVLMYSFSSYMQSTPKRIASYAKLTRQIHTSNQIPDTSEIARIFGFDSVEAFTKDWSDYIKSNDFR